MSSSHSPQPDTGQEAPKTPKIYQVGTLRYTMRGLMLLFAWLLWGDFAFCFFENIFGRFIPLYLKDYQASNKLIGVMMGSIAGGVNILFLPGISRWSDEYRGRWGRRIPFLAVAAPLTVGSVILLGFAPEIAGVLHSQIISRLSPGVSLVTVILCCISAFVVAFHYLNMVLVNAFNWLLRDVVPQEWMARFLSWFRIVSTVAGVLFNIYVFPHIMTHRKEICVGIGAFYLVVFLLMCKKVKEGDYPPPPVREKAESRTKDFLISYWRYLKTCLAIPLYRYSFISSMIMGIAASSGAFNIFFQRDTLGLSLDDLGKLSALCMSISACLYLPMGWLVDKFSPFRISLFAGPISIIICLLSYFFLHDKQGLLIFSLVGIVLNMPGSLAGATITMELYPSDKFAQFFAATNLFSCGTSIIGNWLFGAFMDATQSNYRMIYLWNAAWGIPVYVMAVLVYLGWKRHGGPRNYVPPAPPEYE